MRRPVLLVRPDRNDPDAVAFADAGVPALVDPYLTVRPVSDARAASALLDDLAQAGSSDWLLLTSPRALPSWSALVGEETLATALTLARDRGLRVAAVGPTTADSLDLPPDLVGDSGASSLLAAFAGLPAGRALLPHGRLARTEISDGLQAMGWAVRTAVVYSTTTVTRRPASAGALASGNLAGVLLRSPSAVTAVAHWAALPASVRIFAVGPTTSAAARARGWRVLELPLGTPAAMARSVATALPSLPAVALQERATEAVASTPLAAGLPADHPVRAGRTLDSSLLIAYRGGRPERRPIWMMRQAGRSLPEYRALREGRTMLDSCLDPELAAEITLQPVRRHDVDAAIFFSDIVIPARLAGLGVEIAPGIGPVVANPLRTPAAVAALPELDPAALAPIQRAVKLAVAELGHTPLIGFAGAPFTVASYLVEGHPSRELPITRALMREDPATWHALLAWVARTTTAFLRAQALAGASALQLFDSWAGRLTPEEYHDLSAPHSTAVFAGIADLGLPRVHFGTGTAPLLVAMRDAGADVMGVDAVTPLDEANAILGGHTPLQGNIDPALLAGPWEALAAHTADVLRRGRSAPGHVVNLGHGVPPDTDPDVLTRLVAHVHAIGDEETS